MPAMAMRGPLAPLVNLIFPPRCPLCGEATAEQDGLCPPCWEQIAFPDGSGCPRCDAPLSPGLPEGTECADCLQTRPAHAGPAHSGVVAATYYNDASRQLVLSLKRGGRIALAPLMARMMARRLTAIDAGWLLVPVPLHRWRLWQRGFNQSALIARELSRLTGARLLVDGLHRRRRTPSLGRLGREARALALDGAIVPARARMATLRGARVLLVDDVLTSGATSNACVAALHAAGVREVRVACFARVTDGSMAHV